MAAIKLGVIGFGIMGERLIRAALDRQDSPVKIAGVWDPSVAAQSRLAAELPHVAIAANAETLIESIDCLYIASPPDSHLAHAQAAFDAGKAVLCEKPLSADIDASRAFVAAAGAAQQRIGVNFVFASSPAVAQLAAWLEAGEIGEVEQLNIEVDFAAWPRPWQEDASGWLSKRQQGGFTREVISHFMFLSRRLLGPLALLNHHVTYPDGDGAETAMTAALRAGEVPITLVGQVGGTEKPDHNLWVLQGSRGSIRLRDWSVAECLANDGSWQEAPDAMANEDARPLVLQGQLDKVAAMVRGESHNLATIEEALEVQEIVETLLIA